MKRTVYLDHAAATPVDRAVLAAMQPFYVDQFHNPAATYRMARGAREVLESGKARCAKVIGVKTSEIIMTSGGTEANNLAIAGIMSQYPDKKMLISAIEHESVRVPSAEYNFQEIPVDKNGIIDIEAAIDAVEADTVLVSVMLANNEIGSIQPVKQLAANLEEIRKERQRLGNKLPLLLHTDACQAPLHIDVHPHRLGVDMMTLNGGKIYGPKQTGLLYVSSKVRIMPQVLGGGQQRGRRSGSEWPAQAIGMAVALEKAANLRTSEVKRLSELQDYFFDQLTKTIPSALVNGTRKQRLPNNLHITLPGTDNERILFNLDQSGIMAAAGSACSASSEESSRVLLSMGLDDAAARSSLRLSMGRETSRADVSYVVEVLDALYTDSRS